MPLILQDQHRRGPDYAAHRTMDARHGLRISMAHNRLAILDLTDDSNQPFVDVRTGSCIVFNGEIYNYREIRHELEKSGDAFFTTGDTEVLLKAYLRWGEAAFQKLNGMFAFAIWDAKRETLILARDRFGVKPCYYLNHPHEFAFASTTSALARFFKPGLDLTYLNHGITYHLYEDEHGTSPFRDIRSLPPGYVLEVGRETFDLRPFYDLRERVNELHDRILGWDEPRLLRELEDRFASAVEYRLRSDVPVTLSLSGGLDSALVASFAREFRNGPRVAFTFGDPVDNHSEAAQARLTANHLGIELVPVPAPHAALAALFDKTLADQGAPFAHPSVMAQNLVFQKIHQAGFRVSLGGQGADESFMGYRKFQIFYLRKLLRQRDFARLPGAALGVALLLGSDLKNLKAWAQYRSKYARALPPGAPIRNVHTAEMFDMGLSTYDNLRERQIADVGFASLLTLLRYEDRNSMGQSVESRMPFLDYRMIEFGLALPTPMKLRWGYGKWLLRRLAQPRLPKVIAYHRAKKAFAMDAAEWMRSGLGRHIQQGVQTHFADIRGVFNDSVIATLQSPEAYEAVRNFPLTVAAYWLACRPEARDSLRSASSHACAHTHISM